MLVDASILSSCKSQRFPTPLLHTSNSFLFSGQRRGRGLERPGRPHGYVPGPPVDPREGPTATAQQKDTAAFTVWLQDPNLLKP
ncbi:unnamed protein product [Merluccius merluccius]